MTLSNNPRSLQPLSPHNNPNFISPSAQLFCHMRHEDTLFAIDLAAFAFVAFVE